MHPFSSTVPDPLYSKFSNKKLNEEFYKADKAYKELNRQKVFQSLPLEIVDTIFESIGYITPHQVEKRLNDLQKDVHVKKHENTPISQETYRCPVKLWISEEVYITAPCISKNRCTDEEHNRVLERYNELQRKQIVDNWGYNNNLDEPTEESEAENILKERVDKLIQERQEKEEKYIQNKDVIEDIFEQAKTDLF